MKLIIQPFLLVVLLSSCSFLGWHSGTKGRGIVVTVPQKQVREFDSLDVTSNFIVTYQQDAQKHEVILEAHENLLPLVEIVEKSCCLYVHLKKGASIRETTPINVTVKAPRLRSVKLTGAATMTMDKGTQDNLFKVDLSGSSSLNANEFDVDYLYATLSGASMLTATIKHNMYLDASGAARIEYYGTADKVCIKSSGAATIDGLQAAVRDADVTASGASNIKIAVSENLHVNATGAVAITYKGQPAVELVTAGNATVKQLK